MEVTVSGNGRQKVQSAESRVKLKLERGSYENKKLEKVGWQKSLEGLECSKEFGVYSDR